MCSHWWHDNFFDIIGDISNERDIKIYFDRYFSILEWPSQVVRQDEASFSWLVLPAWSFRGGGGEGRKLGAGPLLVWPLGSSGQLGWGFPTCMTWEGNGQCGCLTYLTYEGAGRGEVGVNGSPIHPTLGVGRHKCPLSRWTEWHTPVKNTYVFGNN